MRVSAESLSRCEQVIETYLECADEMANFYRSLYYSDAAREITLARETIRVLNRYQADRALGAYCLIVNGLVWDAEIVIRAIYETSSKILFLAASTSARREELAEEYWTELSSIYDRKGADRAEIVERLAQQFNENDARIFRHLRDPRFFRTDPVANKRARNDIEQRWSFSGIIKTLSTSSALHERVEGLNSLSHMYGMMSHLAHASPKALDLMEDRGARTDGLSALEVSHICRMLSDLVSLGVFSLRYSYQVETGIRIADDNLLHRIFEKMNIAANMFRAEFDRSQDDFY